MHGEPDLKLDGKQGQATALKDRLIEITITQRNMEIENILQAHHWESLLPVTKSIKKRFLPTMTIRHLKNMIQRLFKSSQQELILLQGLNQPERTMMAMTLDDELRDLKFYSMSNGDEITLISVI